MKIYFAFKCIKTNLLKIISHSQVYCNQNIAFQMKTNRIFWNWLYTSFRRIPFFIQMCLKHNFIWLKLFIILMHLYILLKDLPKLIYLFFYSFFFKIFTSILKSGAKMDFYSVCIKLFFQSYSKAKYFLKSYHLLLLTK